MTTSPPVAAAAAATAAVAAAGAAGQLHGFRRRRLRRRVQVVDTHTPHSRRRPTRRNHVVEGSSTNVERKEAGAAEGGRAGADGPVEIDGARTYGSLFKRSASAAVVRRMCANSVDVRYAQHGVMDPVYSDCGTP